MDFPVKACYDCGIFYSEKYKRNRYDNEDIRCYKCGNDTKDYKVPTSSVHYKTALVRPDEELTGFIMSTLSCEVKGLVETSLKKVLEKNNTDMNQLVTKINANNMRMIENLKKEMLKDVITFMLAREEEFLSK